MGHRHTEMTVWKLYYRHGVVGHVLALIKAKLKSKIIRLVKIHNCDRDGRKLGHVLHYYRLKVCTQRPERKQKWE